MALHQALCLSTQVIKIIKEMYSTDILLRGYNTRNLKLACFVCCVVSIKKISTLLVVCHKLVLKSVPYPKIVKNTPILIEQSIACNVYT